MPLHVDLRFAGSDRMFGDYERQEAPGMHDANRTTIDELSDSAVSIIVISSGDENERHKNKANGKHAHRQLVMDDILEAVSGDFFPLRPILIVVILLLVTYQPNWEYPFTNTR